MAEYKAQVHWERSGPDFAKGKYSREHTWAFDGGVKVPASPAPSSVPAPWSNPACVDPEEAYVAALSSCHMLTFLFLASKEGWVVDSYHDDALGVMTKNEKGIPWVSAVTLHPRIIYGGPKTPTAEDEHRLHHLAHEQCYIANSVKTDLQVHPPRD